MTHDEAQTKAREIALRFYGPLDRSCEHLMDAITPALLDAQKEGVWACAKVVNAQNEILTAKGGKPQKGWPGGVINGRVTACRAIAAALAALLPKEEK